MDKNNRSSAIAAAIILIGFGLTAFVMPKIMLAIGAYSPVAAGAVAVLFVAAFFMLFWLRSRRQRNGD